MANPLPNLSRAPNARPFSLRPDWNGHIERREVVDVNLGHTPESFVRAAHAQLTGKAAPDALVRRWAHELRQNPRLRRVDLVRLLAKESDRTVELAYGDPWRAHPELDGAPERLTARQVGAVFMYFFNCPGGVNCTNDWANSHALGMDRPHPLYGFERGQSGFYLPSEAGFWKRELRDAKWSGLDFLLLNTYGPDIQHGKLAPLSQALRSLKDPVKIAFMDDTWTWGQPWFGPFWQKRPDLSDPAAAAKTIYDAKWGPFYRQLEREHWYRFKDKPFIYFYNAGTLEPRAESSQLLRHLKAMFEAEFGETPFLCVDSAYFDDPRLETLADARFQWFTFDLPEKRSRSTMNGHIIDHAMVRWDSVGRDRPGELATHTDLLVKGSELLEQVLHDSSDAELLVLATWNDLGEGTGIHRNYDYWAGGSWLSPEHFMRKVRVSQSTARRKIHVAR
ncbi:MAG TPA: DUF5010 domain-containing protein [Polyangiaceae bacterium]|nr:DUF5010 domain-containing protein [Polyangiaceae bacterium]